MAEVADTTLRPKLLRIGQRNYRTNLPDDGAGSAYTEGDSVVYLGGAVAQDAEQLDDGRYKLDVDVPHRLLGSIIGRGGKTKAQLEKETGTTIVVPGRKAPSATPVTVLGATIDAVESCRTRIELLAEDARRKTSPTHFVSIPLGTVRGSGSAQLCSEVAAFKDEVNGLYPDDEFPGAWFTDPLAMHLTICVLKLLTDSEVETAASVLQEAAEEVTGMLPSDPEIDVRGVGIMNDDPTQVDVLFAHCQLIGGNLQAVVDKVLNAFQRSGLVQHTEDSVKIHATLINNVRTVGRQRGGQRQRFDAQTILDTFKSRHFGNVPLQGLHLSRMSDRPSGKYYLADAVSYFETCG